MGGGGGAGLRDNRGGERGRVQRRCPRTTRCAAWRRGTARGIPRASMERGRRADRQPTAFTGAPRAADPGHSWRSPRRAASSRTGAGGRWREKTSRWRSSCSSNTPVASRQGGWWKKGKRCASSPWRVLAAAAPHVEQPPISKRIFHAALFCRASATCSIQCPERRSVCPCARGATRCSQSISKGQGCRSEVARRPAAIGATSMTTRAVGAMCCPLIVNLSRQLSLPSGRCFSIAPCSATDRRAVTAPWPRRLSFATA